MLTLENVDAKQVDAVLRWRHPELPEPLVLPWSERPVLGLDGATPWLYAPAERDPLAVRGRVAVPRPELRRLRRATAWGVQFGRVAVAHELDPRGAVRDLLPDLADGPRTCTDAVAAAVVGPQPVHPAVRGVARMLDATVGQRAARRLAITLDPLIFGVVGLPDIEVGRPALFYVISAWRW